MPEIDKYTIEHEPILSKKLMKRAARTITDDLLLRIDKSQKVFIFAGPGNNGGDALVVAIDLLKKQYNVKVLVLSKKMSPDAEYYYHKLKKSFPKQVSVVESVKGFPKINSNDYIVEGIFGSGLTRKVEGLYADCIQYINNSGATVFSVDIPSGLFGEQNSDSNRKAAVSANYTYSFQFPKLAFMFNENHKNTGTFIIKDIGLHQEFIEKKPTSFYYLTEDDIKNYIKPRHKFAHKGSFGHALIMGGSKDKAGAIMLTAGACLRSGVGLLTAHVPESIVGALNTKFPECMISIDYDKNIVTNIPRLNKYNAIAVGPGMGTDATTVKGLEQLLKEVETPIVLDADALNICAANPKLFRYFNEKTIITPHPKEFERLFGNTESDYERLMLQIEKSKEFKITIVLKGAHTSISLSDGSVYFNSTGNPGMATGGSGDVLTGIIAALLAQDYNAKEAAIIGVYLHGLAGDYAKNEKGQTSLIASDIISNLSQAFIKIEPK